MPKFVPRERKHRRLDRQRAKQQGEQALRAQDDTNLETLLPTQTQQRRQQLQDELRAQQPEAKVSGKKRKRLDKYIETKLKKEENLELLKKLAAHKVDTSLLQSAKKLGRRNESKRERFERALNERKAGIDVDGQQDAVLFERRSAPAQVTALENSEDDEDDSQKNDAVTPPTVPAQSLASAVSFGGGLKRPLELNESGQPIIKKRKRRKVQNRLELLSLKNHTPVQAIAQTSGDEQSELEEGWQSDVDEEWNGFDSDDAHGESTEDDESESIDTSSEEYESNDQSGSDTASSPDGRDEEEPTARAERSSAFKAWANSQRNEALGFTPSLAPTNDLTLKAVFKPREASPDPEVLELAATASNPALYRPTTSVLVNRSEEIQTARLELPVTKDEQRIMEAVHNNPVTVVCGATGSGKTTQIPQMLFENGYASKGMIGITQPRRVAAVSVANRVALELGSEFGKSVAHQVRYDSTVRRDTAIKFMTDGILLREISHDFVLSKYSVIVIDEAHERSVNTDILIGMLSRIVPLRDELSKEDPKKHHPLKLLVMSATLRVKDFIMNDRLFPLSKPPIVQAEGRQFQVTEHFARRTHRNYVDETVNKVARGHRKLPPGAFLVFLTGQDEIHAVTKRLKEMFAADATGFASLKARDTSSLRANTGSKFVEEEDTGDQSDSEAEITGLDDEEDDAEFVVEDDPLVPRRPATLRAHILPLYASLPSEQQLLVFNPPPDDSRLIILSTNVAETSLTIPGVRYVFDCGRSKEKTYDTATGVQEFRIGWISKASASQRMGRAGRTGPGHCYRLYSSAVYEQFFEEHTEPELLRTPIEGTVLQLKNMEVDNVINFPFPTPPRHQQLVHATQLLTNLGAVSNDVGKITDIGRELLRYPVNPRFGKILLLGLRNGVLDHTIALVAGMAVGDLFIPEPQLASRTAQDTGMQNGSDDENDGEPRKTNAIDNALLTAAQQRRQAYGRANATLSAWDDKCDALKILTAVAASAQEEPGDRAAFCADYFLREKGMAEVEQLRVQLHNIMHSPLAERSNNNFAARYAAPLPPPSSKQITILKQIVAAGYIDQVAIRADLLPSPPAGYRAPRRAIEVPYRSLLPAVSEADIDRTASAAEQEQQQFVFVHPSSVIARLSTAEMPPYIIFSDLSRASAATVGANQMKRTRMRALTPITQSTLAALAEDTPLLEFGKPIGKLEENNEGSTKKRQCWVGVTLRDPKGSTGLQGWQLGAWKVIQARKGKEWIIEKVIARGGGGNK